MYFGHASDSIYVKKLSIKHESHIDVDTAGRRFGHEVFEVPRAIVDNCILPFPLLETFCSHLTRIFHLNCI